MNYIVLLNLFGEGDVSRKQDHLKCKKMVTPLPDFWGKIEVVIEYLLYHLLDLYLKLFGH